MRSVGQTHSERTVMKTLKDLRETLPQTGRLEWIGIASERMADLQSVPSATVQPGTGLDGEHHATSGKSDRQVTMLQHEHLAVIESTSGRSITPELLRRNLTVSGINLLALKDRRFRIGEVIFEGTGKCDPCSRMEYNLGDGGFNAMLGHGGITTRVLEGGTIHVGDLVEALNN